MKNGGLLQSLEGLNRRLCKISIYLSVFLSISVSPPPSLNPNPNISPSPLQGSSLDFCLLILVAWTRVELSPWTPLNLQLEHCDPGTSQSRRSINGASHLYAYLYPHNWLYLFVSPVGSVSLETAD